MNQQTCESSSKLSYKSKDEQRSKLSHLEQLWSYVHLSCSALLIIIILWGTLIDNRMTKSASPNMPIPLSDLRKSLDLKQWWSLYAPDVPNKDGWALIALWNGEKWLDPRSGQAPILSLYPTLDRQWSAHLERIAHELVRPSLKPLRDRLQNGSWTQMSKEVV